MSTPARVTCLIALSMSREYCITATLFVVLFSFIYFCNFPNYNFFQNDNRYPFPMPQRLFSVDEHIVLLEENIARNPECFESTKYKKFSNKNG